MEANFLLYPDSFQLNDWTKFCDYLGELNNAILLAKDNGDNIFRNDDILYIQTPFGYPLYQLAYFEDEADERAKVAVIPCLQSQDIRNFLVELLGYLPTDYQVSTLQELDIEFPDGNNGLMGLSFDTLDVDIHKCVNDKKSWYKFHYQYLNNHPEDSSYFKYTAKRHLEIETLLLPKPNNYTSLSQLTNHEYVDINGGKGFFIVKNDYFFIFPNLHISNSLKSWYLIYKTKGRTDKEKDTYKTEFGGLTKPQIATNFAEEVAIVNFYIYTEDISKHNDKYNRNAKKTPYKIHKRGEGKYQTFLSVDFEKCTFEVHNNKGEHIGEYRLDGKRNDTADQDGNHDILIP